MADSPRGVDAVDSMDFNDTNKEPEKKKSRRPPSEHPSICAELTGLGLIGVR